MAPSRLKTLEFGKEAKALRLEIHTVLKQVDYDYQRMQYNTVVSGAMKMINALEDFKAIDGCGCAGGAGAKASASCCAACTRPRRTSRTRCGTSWAMPRQLGDLLDAPWPQVDAAALVQDEIELMLQINGKLRGSIVVSASADKAAIEQAAWPARCSRS